MARPRKTGLDYYPMDVDFWDDLKIIDLMNEYGPLGAAVYDIVISQVYKNGYYLEVPLEKLAVLIIRMIGNRWIKDKSLVLEIIQYCGEIGLFHQALLSKSVITSVGIQRRYAEVTARSKADKSRYWLLEEAPVRNKSAAQTPVSATKTDISADSAPQKERKENQTKEQERKVCVLSIPCLNGDFGVDEDYLHTLTNTYKDMDVQLSLRQLRSYMLSNPQRQRPLNSAKGCIEWWLNGDNAASKYRKDPHPPTYNLDEYELTNAIFDEGF